MASLNIGTSITQPTEAEARRRQREQLLWDTKNYLVERIREAAEGGTAAIQLAVKTTADEADRLAKGITRNRIPVNFGGRRAVALAQFRGVSRGKPEISLHVGSIK